MNDRVIFANDIAYAETDLDPFDALRCVIAFSADDWGESRAMAWVYGIVLGWDDDDPMEGETGQESMDELARKFGWDATKVARLRALHERFSALGQVVA